MKVRLILGAAIASAATVVFGLNPNPLVAQDADNEVAARFATGSNRTPSAAASWLLSAKLWLNTVPLRAEDLTGKVVLVNFWTYSCINSLRVCPETSCGIT
jgi:thiol-disulfide isomerase/thioredoxin